MPGPSGHSPPCKPRCAVRGGEFAHVPGSPSRSALCPRDPFSGAGRGSCGKYWWYHPRTNGRTAHQTSRERCQKAETTPAPGGLHLPRTHRDLSCGFGQCRIGIHAANSGGTGEVARWCENALLMTRFRWWILRCSSGGSSRDAGCDGLPLTSGVNKCRQMLSSLR